jgi:exoribonuclease-2
MPAKQNFDESAARVDNGSLCIYEHDGRPLLAVCLGTKAQKTLLLNQRGREAELPAYRLCLLGEKLPPQVQGREQTAEYLSDLASKSESRSQTIQLEELWLTLVSSEKEYSSHELSDLLLGSTKLEAHFALRLALLSDRIYFKRGATGFIPRSVEVVEELKKSEKSRAEKAKAQESALEFFSKRHKDKSSPVPPELTHSVRTLLEVAAGCAEIENNQLKEAKEIVDFCAERLKLELRGSREQRIIHFLEYAGLLTPNTNLAFIRQRFNLERPKSIEEKARALQVPTTLESLQQLFGPREDLSEVFSFSIDDVSTKDMDDAISLERTRDGYRLGIHITDAAALIPAQSELDTEAKRRAISIYCPEIVVNMLPEVLSEGALSLIAGQLRLALSCIIELDHRFSILATRVTPSIIRVGKRYTYKEVDESLYQSESELHLLYNITSHFEEQRIQKGALKGGKKEMLVVLDASGGLSLNEIDENSPARSLVAECMVLANSVFAEFGDKNNIPLIYRGQSAPEPSEPNEGDENSDSSAQTYQLRSKLKKSFTSVTPVRHTSLALDAYIQATSPIRRYADIVNQRQLISFIKGGKAEHDAKEIEELIKSLDDPLATAQAISKETKRFWLLRYLQERARTDAIVHGIVLRTDLRTPLVEIQEVLMPTLVRFEQTVKPGDQVKLRVCKIDPRQGFARFEFIEFI